MTETLSSARLQAGPRGPRKQTARLALSVWSVLRLAEDEKPRSTGREARGRRRLGQEAMALKRLKQVMAMLSSDVRRDMYIFIAAIVFLVVAYLLTEWRA